MALRRYQMTGRGSISRWENRQGEPCRGTIPPDAILAYHSASENAEIILEEEIAAKSEHAHFKLIPILDRDSLIVKTGGDGAPPPVVGEGADRVTQIPSPIATQEPRATGTKRRPRPHADATVSATLEG